MFAAEETYDDAVRELPLAATTRPIALIGFMGIGKTTTNAQLARRLRWPSVDTDALVESRSNTTIREIFDWFGEPRFRELEYEVILAEATQPGRVLSLGGGAFISDRNRELLLEHCTVVYLAAPWSHVSGSIQRLKNSRPLLRGRSTTELQRLFDSRHIIYNQAHIRVCVAGRTPAQVAERILELIGATR